ncbi:hypothetical protein FALBO_6875 [Fusarium albosuccineum]|uniref:Uncharacterized protein n=1 Tax=Fusarium albosuccineum TaxID=1237068 RepID=A0A8H4LE06_9HYPO|nr:hypothetical protein FALBO_6875 [Fusarium albosuccineum]
MSTSEEPQPEGRISLKFNLSSFDLTNNPGHHAILANELVDAFHGIRPKMSPVLADILAQWLPKVLASSLYNIQQLSAPQHHPLWSLLRGKNESGQKRLSYSAWFFMAVMFGPAHPMLEPIRRDMSELWGVHFPADSIFYPDVSDEMQKKCFDGFITYDKPESAGTTSVLKPAADNVDAANTDILNTDPAVLASKGIVHPTKAFHRNQTDPREAIRRLDEIEKPGNLIEGFKTPDATIRASGAESQMMIALTNRIRALEKEVTMLRAQNQEINTALGQAKSTTGMACVKIRGLQAKVEKHDTDIADLVNHCEKTDDKVEGCRNGMDALAETMKETQAKLTDIDGRCEKSVDISLQLMDLVSPDGTSSSKRLRKT